MLALVFSSFFTFSSLSVKQTKPGNSLPSSSSSDAPPPVDICVNLSPNPNLLIAAAESPPPTIEIALELAIASAVFSVPILNFSTSHIPSGPFHITVLAACTSLENSLTVLGPMSQPCHPS